MSDTPSLWPQILTGLGALTGVSALIGVWLNRKRVPAEVRLITAQAEVAQATRESLAADVATKTLQSAEARIRELVEERKELREEVREWKRHAGEAEVAREKALEQVKLLEDQAEKMRAWLKANDLEFPS